jgi:hypothetical protein
MPQENESNKDADKASDISPLLALSDQEQEAIRSLSYIEQELFVDYLLDHHTSGQDYYEGWTRCEFREALFAGPQAFRDAFEYSTKRRSDG